MRIFRKNLKNNFPWFKNHPDYTYFDSAATALKPRCVIQAITKYYEEYCSNPHNTDSALTYQTSEIIHQTKIKLGNLIHCDPDEIAFTSGATEGLNLIAHGLSDEIQPGDEIVLTYGEHASNILPWMEVAKQCGAKIVYAGKEHQIPTVQDFINALSPKTKVVAFASGFNVTGTANDEAKITKAIKQYSPNIFVVVDATQSITHREINIAHDQFDFMACSAHKMFGPTGLGMVRIPKAIISKMKPLRYGGGMNFSINTQDYQLLENISKFEGGTSHAAGIFGWGAAIDFLQAIGYKAIQKHELELAEYAKEQLSKIPEIKIYNLHEHAPNIAFNFAGVSAQDLASYLGSKKMIVRSGLSCAKLLCHILDTNSLIRISLSIYNTKEDLDRLYEILKNYQKGDELDGLFEG